MMGDAGSPENNHQPTPGMYLLAAQDIFTLLQAPEYSKLGLSISFYEIYCGKVFDLLNQRKQLAIRSDAKEKVNICGLVEKKVMNIH